MSRRRTAAVRAGAMLAALTVSAAIRPADGQQPDRRPGVDDRHGSFVNTSFEAETALTKAQALGTAGDWAAAARAMQSVGETFGDRVIASDADRFVSIRRHVNRVIAAWPREGVEAYRNLYEREARRALERLGETTDPGSLVEIAERYYATRTGATALAAAAELATEAGAFASARRWYGKLLADHPDAATEAAGWRLKQAACTAWAGDSTPLRAISEANPAETPGPSVRFRDRDAALGDAARVILADFDSVDPPSSSPGTAGVWFGGAARDGCFETAATPEATLWRFTGLEPDWLVGRGGDYHSAAARTEAVQRIVEGGRWLSMAPAAGGGRVFVQDGRRVWAIDPDGADRPCWRFELHRRTHSVDASTPEDDAPEFHTTTVSDGRVFVRLGVAPQDEQREADPPVCIVCLDAATGAEIWRNDFAEFRAAFEDLDVDGAPLPHADRLYAVVRRRRAFGFEACYLACMDRRTGATVWATHVAEAATGTYGYRRATLSFPAAEDDLVFVQSNLGTVAAVSARTGRIEWVHRYSTRDPGDAAERFWYARDGQRTRSWHYQPTMVWRDRVLAMPLDADALLCLDQDDGRLVRSAPLEALRSPSTVLGIRDDHLYVVGSTVVSWNLREWRIEWDRPLTEGRLLGRGAVTSAGLFIPTDRGLLRYPLVGGAAYIHRWSSAAAGNLLALPGQIVVASAEAVYGLIGRDEGLVQLTRRASERADDPRAALQLAEMAFEVGAFRRGLEAVDDAVSRAGGFARLTDDALRGRLFADLLQFTDRVAGRADTGADELAIAADLLTRAGQCAPDVDGQVAYRLRLAAVLVRRRMIAAAVATCQQVLGDRTLAAARVDDPPALPFMPTLRAIGDESGAAPTEAGALAARWIDHLIAAHGPEVYADIERRAGERLTVAMAAKDADAVLAVARTFPNARACAQAFVRHAELMTAAGRHADAVRSLRRALRYPTRIDRPAVVRELVKRLLASGQPRTAKEWIGRAARDHPKARFGHHGRDIGFAEWGRELGLVAVGGVPTRATVAWPVRPAFRRLFPDPLAVLEPAFRRSADTPWDAVVTYAGGQIEARQAAPDRAVWPKPVPCPVQPILLSADAERYVFATQGRVFALTRTSGGAAWEIGEEPPADPNADPESLPSWVSHAVTADRVYCANDRGELVCADRRDGTIRWRHDECPRNGGGLVAGEGWAAYVDWRRRRNVVTILSAEDGTVRHTLRLPDDRPVQDLRPAADGSLLAVLSRHVAVIDPATGQERCRLAGADRFVMSTMTLGPEGLYVSCDGRRVTAFDLESGESAWTTPVIAAERRDGLWCEVADGALFAASGSVLMAFDAFDGRTLWEVRNAPARAAAAPRIVGDSIVVWEEIAAEKPADARAEPPNQPAAPERHRYQVRRFALSDGRELPTGTDGPLVTEPFESFGGWHARDGCLLALDGNRLIGYVAPPD